MNKVCEMRFSLVVFLSFRSRNSPWPTQNPTQCPWVETLSRLMFLCCKCGALPFIQTLAEYGHVLVVPEKSFSKPIMKIQNMVTEKLPR